jgi:hypothetical protein
MTTQKEKEFAVRVLQAPTPWSAFVIELSGFPLPEPERALLEPLLGRMVESAAKRWRLQSEVFLELEQMKGLECRYTVADNGKAWLPEVGLGVWPDRDPPAPWTREEIENLRPGEKMRELLCEVFRISTSQEQRIKARNAILKVGAVVEILTADATEDLLGKLKPVYLDFIKARSHRCFPYYIPLLEGRAFENMTADQLNHWCPGISVYVRESFQDQGVLVASPLPILDLVKELGIGFAIRTKGN